VRYISRLRLILLLPVVISKFAWAESSYSYSASLARLIAEDEIKLARSTIAQFVSSGSSASMSGSSASGLVEEDLLSLGESDGGSIQTLSSRAGIEVGLEQSLVEVSPALRVVGSIGFGTSTARYGFPDGIGVFVDPARATFNEWHVDLGTGVKLDGKNLPVGGLFTAANLFARYSRQTLNIESALLEIRYSQDTITPGAGVSLGWRVPMGDQATVEISVFNTYICSLGRQLGILGQIRWH
jgi:hypothetical protein